MVCDWLAVCLPRNTPSGQVSFYHIHYSVPTPSTVPGMGHPLGKYLCWKEGGRGGPPSSGTYLQDQPLGGSCSSVT